MFNPVYNADGRISYFRVLCLSVAFGCFICGCMVDNDKKSAQRTQNVASVQEETLLPAVKHDYKQIRTLALEEFTFDVEYLQTCGTLDRGFDNCVVELSDSLKPYYSLNLDASADGYKIAFVANEDSKFGLDASETIAMVTEIAKLPHIHIKGLMTIAPFVDEGEENRKYFNDLKQLSVDIDKQNIDNVTMNVLSMGMTNDFEVAIEEGATMVRVGTAIFGERNYVQ